MNEKNKYLETPTDDTIIWRYMDFPKLLSIFTKKALWFSRMDNLTDEYEGTLPTENFTKLWDAYKKLGTMSSMEAFQKASKESDSIAKFKAWTLVNSWSINDNESFALWKIYLGNSPYGIAIRTDIGRLKECLKVSDDKIFHYKVRYIDHLSDALETVNQDEVVSSKRDFYSYEKEFRTVIKNQFDVDSENNRTPRFTHGKYVPINPSLLIERIYTSPLAPTWFTELVEKTINELIEPIDKEPIKVHQSWIKDKI